MKETEISKLLETLNTFTKTANDVVNSNEENIKHNIHRLSLYLDSFNKFMTTITSPNRKLTLDIIESHLGQGDFERTDHDDSGYTWVLEKSDVDVSGSTIIGHRPLETVELEGLDGYLMIETEAELLKFKLMSFAEICKFIKINNSDFPIEEYLDEEDFTELTLDIIKSHLGGGTFRMVDRDAGYTDWVLKTSGVIVSGCTMCDYEHVDTSSLEGLGQYLEIETEEALIMYNEMTLEELCLKVQHECLVDDIVFPIDAFLK